METSGEQGPGKPPEAGQTGAAAPPGQPKPGQTGAPGGVAAEIEGLRAWVAQLDRKLGVRSYAGGAALVLALAAGIVAIVLVLGVKEDSATTDDLERLRDEVAGVEESATQAAQDDLAGLTDRVEAIESQVAGLRTDTDASAKEIEVLQDDIVDLRNDIAALESSSSTDTSSTDSNADSGE
jgi:uncharacterized protein HemX